MENWKKNVATFITSQTVSLLGSMLVGYTILWYVTLKTQSGIVMMIMSFCNFIPALIVSPFSGVWADRLNRKKIMISADSMIAFFTLVFAILFAFGIKDLWIVFVITIIRSIGQTIHQPAVSATYPQIVPKENLIRVQGISQGIQSASMVVMPVLAGALLATVPLEYILMIDVVTAILAIFILMKFVKLPKHKAEENKEEIKYFDDIKQGLKYVGSHYLILKILIFGFLFMILVAAPSYLTYIQVARVFGDEPWRLAVLEAFFGVGMLTGSIIVSMWKNYKNRLAIFFVTYIAIGLGTIGLGIPFNFCVYVSFWLFVGLFIAISNPIFVGLVQEKVEPAFIGRVFSVFGLMNTISLPLGMVFFGPLSDFVDVSLIILICGILMVIVAFIPLLNRKLLSEGK